LQCVVSWSTEQKSTAGGARVDKGVSPVAASHIPIDAVAFEDERVTEIVEGHPQLIVDTDRASDLMSIDRHTAVAGSD